MPRMEGAAACEAIRALAGPASIAPIIARNADVIPRQIERCRRAGMVDHVAKPIDREALYTVINRWLISIRSPPDTRRDDAAGLQVSTP